jgi:hypothetical protein
MKDAPAAVQACGISSTKAMEGKGKSCLAMSGKQITELMLSPQRHKKTPIIASLVAMEGKAKPGEGEFAPVSFNSVVVATLGLIFRTVLIATAMALLN